MKIVLDTNIIVSDFWLKGNSFKIFLENINRAGHSLFTPIIVLEEATNKYREELCKLLQDLEKSNNAINKLINQDLQILQTNLDIDKAVYEYRQHLEHQLYRSRLTSARYIFYPDVSHEQLVERTLKRRKPFSTKGTGYRDALIWYGILSVIKSYGADKNDPVALISKNISDFADKNNRLHSDLVQDIVERNLDLNSVIFYPDIQAFNEEQILNLFNKLDDLQCKLSIGGIKEDWFRRELCRCLSLNLLENQIDCIEASFPEEIENLIVKEILEILKYEIKNVRKLNSITASYVVIEVDCQTICEVSGIVARSKLDILYARGYQFLSIKNNDKTYVDVIVRAVINFSALLIDYQDQGMVAELNCVTVIKCC